MPIQHLRPVATQLVAVLAGTAAPITAAAFVLIAFVANDVPIMWLWRPLAISVMGSLVVLLLLWRLLGLIRGSVWAFVAVAVATGLFVVAGLTVLALAAFGAVRSRPRREYELVGVLASISSLLLLGVPTAIGVQQGAFDWGATESDSVRIRADSPGPNIHMLLLDGYPRADVLASAGFDNGEFLDAMRDRGFDVYGDSLSNYDLTPFSLLSMLSLEHVETMGSLGADADQLSAVEQRRLVTRALMDAPIFAALERIGYETRLQTGNVVATSIGGADVVWNAGTATNFELDALQRTPLAGLVEVFGFAAGQHREHIEASLAEFAMVPQSPSFRFAHVLAPHAPFVYRADGTPAPSPPCYPASCQLFHPVAEGVGWSRDEYRGRMVAHIQYVNGLVLRSIDDVVALDPDAVIVVLSDHGTSGEDELDRFRNLILARTPGHPRLLGEAPTPINVLPKVLNAYLGAGLPELPDTLHKHGDGEAWLEFEQVSAHPPTGHSHDRRNTTSFSSR